MGLEYARQLARKGYAPVLVSNRADELETAGAALAAETGVPVRTLFCVYSEDEQEGGLNLLNLMERIRISLMENPILDRQFRLDDEGGIEQLVYPDDTAPFFLGEMMTVWKMPPVRREERSVWDGQPHKT